MKLTRNQTKRRRIRSSKFSCCREHKKYGNGEDALCKTFKCDDCDSLWDSECLKDKFGLSLREISHAVFWQCPDCWAFESGSSEEAQKSYKKKKYKERKSRKTKSKVYNIRRDNSDISYLSLDSTDSERQQKKKDKKNKKITIKLKKKKQKEKAIKNRLNNIDGKYGFKFDTKMVDVTDSATDEDFDSNLWYPEQKPKTDKALENLRKKKCEKNKCQYFKLTKTSSYRDFEKAAVILTINDIADHPNKYKYNVKFGFCQTDIAEHASNNLYKIRCKNPNRHMEIPLRTAASVKSLFKRWTDNQNKETNEKDWISRFVTAKSRLEKLGKKAASDVNTELMEFGHEYAVVQLENTRKELKKVKQKVSVAETVQEAMADVRGLIKELKDVPVNSNINNKCESNPYIGNDLKDAQNNFSPVNNDNFINKYSMKASVNSNNNKCESNPYIGNNLKDAQNNFSPENNDNFINKYSMKAPVNEHKNEDFIYRKNVDECCKFLTRLGNLPRGPFDEENDLMAQQLISCERKLFDDSKAHKLGVKFNALNQVTPKLSDQKILYQLSRTAEFL